MGYTLDLCTDPERFDGFVEGHPHGSVLQESSWVRVKDNWGHLLASAIDENGDIAATGLVLIRSLPLGYKLYYLPRGPLVRDDDPELWEFFLKALAAKARQDKAICLKFDPLIIHDVRKPGDLDKAGEPDRMTELLKKLGARHHGYTLRMSATAQPRTLAVVHYEKTGPAKAKLRYYLNRASNKGVTIARAGIEGVGRFASLEAKTAVRKNVSLRNEEYFRKLMEVYGDKACLSFERLELAPAIAKANQLKSQCEEGLAREGLPANKEHDLRERLASARKDLEQLRGYQEEHGAEVWISGALIVRSGRYSELLYAGMDDQFKLYRSYNSYQDAIDWARESGCAYCDLGGVEGTLDDGLTVFKDLFQADFETYIGEFDYPVRPLAYRLFNRLLPLAKKILAHKAEEERK